MENKTIDIEPRAAVEMLTWKNIYDIEIRYYYIT